jgi:hypothetical protein
MPRESFRRAERILHRELLEARARFHSKAGRATEFTAALKRYTALILEGTIPEDLIADAASATLVSENRLSNPTIKIARLSAR